MPRKRKLIPGAGYAPTHAREAHSDKPPVTATDTPEQVNGSQAPDTSDTGQNGAQLANTSGNEAEPIRYMSNGRQQVPEHGRPDTFDQDVADRICEQVASGAKHAEIYGEAGLPKQSTVYSWLRWNVEFSADFARAMHRRADWRADQMDQIVSDVLTERTSPNAGRMAVDTYKWLASKENPARYGDKVTNVHEGGDKPIQTQSMALTDLTLRLQTMADQQPKREPDQDDS